MPMSHPKFKAAAVQASPVLHDLDAGVEKTIALIEQAGQAGARLIAFPETWIPGYPYWAWLGPPAWGMRFIPAYHDNALIVGSAPHREICAAAKRHALHVVLGFAEKAGGSLYIAQSLIGPDGEVIANRRKLRPTHVERSVYGDGDGSGLAVHDTEIGRLGALCCWEHLQPLTKYAMYSMNEQVHVASWPTLSLYRGKAYALGPEANMAASQVYALEGQCYVLAATSIITEEAHALMGLTPEQAELIPVGGGSTRIFAPDGQPIGAELAPDEEGLVYAEIDLGLISLAKAAADPAGHYARPDVTQLLLNTAPAKPVVQAMSEASSATAPRVVAGVAEPNEAEKKSPLESAAG